MEDLNKFSLQTILKWRNSASERIDKSDQGIVQLSAKTARLVCMINKIKKKRQKDAVWARKLNRHLFKIIFKHRPHRI